MPTNKVRHIVVVSDLHVGSSIALCPESFDDGDGPALKVREWLRSKWATFVSRVGQITHGDPFILVLNGDLTEGLHHGKDQLLIRSTVRQYRAALALIKPLVKLAHCTYIVEGTQCHTLDDEADIAEELSEARVIPSPNGWAWQRLKLTLNGKVHSFRHHIGTTSRPYLEPSALGIALGVERLESMSAGETPTDIIIAAHRHIGGMVKTTLGMGIVTPSWQFPTRHVFKVSPNARPCVGGCVLDYSREPHGEFPHVHFLHYRPDPDEGVSHD